MVIITITQYFISRLSDPSEEKAAELNLKAELHGQLTAVKDQIKTVADSVTILLEERENRQNSFDVRIKLFVLKFVQLHVFLSGIS